MFVSSCFLREKMKCFLFCYLDNLLCHKVKIAKVHNHAQKHKSAFLWSWSLSFSVKAEYCKEEGVAHDFFSNSAHFETENCSLYQYGQPLSSSSAIITDSGIPKCQVLCSVWECSFQKEDYFQVPEPLLSNKAIPKTLSYVNEYNLHNSKTFIYLFSYQWLHSRTQGPYKKMQPFFMDVSRTFQGPH